MNTSNPGGPLNKQYEIQGNSMEKRNAPQIPIVYKRQNLLSNTTCTPRHDKENHLYGKN